jgi:hypothetical protein
MILTLALESLPACLPVLARMHYSIARRMALITAWSSLSVGRLQARHTLIALIALITLITQITQLGCLALLPGRRSPVAVVRQLQLESHLQPPSSTAMLHLAHLSAAGRGKRQDGISTDIPSWCMASAAA